MTEKNSVGLIYAIVKDSVAAQQAQKSTLDTKASTLTGFGGGMIALLLGARDIIMALPQIARLLVISSAGLFLLSIFLATIVGWVRKHRSDPNPVALAENYIDKTEQDVQLQVIANLVGAWKINSRRLENYAIMLRIGLFLQTIAFIFLGIVLIWVLI